METEMLFSIVIPTYNRADFIGKTVQSVIRQSYSNWELVIIDDGSTDNTEEVVKTINNPRIRYSKVENGERGRARNIGSQKSSGDYIYFLDSDDLLYPDHLFTAYEHIKEKQPELLWLPYEQVNKDGKVLRPHHPLKGTVLDTLISEGNFMSCHGVFLRKDIASDFQFNEDRELAGSEDMELWLRLASRYPFVIGSKVTSALVEHDARSVMNFNDIHKLIKRKELMLTYLLEDSTVMHKVGKRIGRLRSSAYSYIALHAMMNKNTSSSLAWKYFWKSLLSSPTCILSKRSLAIVKYGLKRTFS
jgi:glycosyltransferase involved in cell wall biosynthesis